MLALVWLEVLVRELVSRDIFFSVFWLSPAKTKMHLDRKQIISNDGPALEPHDIQETI